MVWVMVLPNGLLLFRILNWDFRSHSYIDLFCQCIISICKLNYEQSFWFQLDNSRIHTAMIAKEWMTDFPVLPWPDLNIMENIWKMLEDIIYDRSPILSLIDLKEEIQKAFLVIIGSKRRNIINLYKTFRCRLVKVIKNNGNQMNN